MKDVLGFDKVLYGVEYNKKQVKGLEGRSVASLFLYNEIRLMGLYVCGLRKYVEGRIRYMADFESDKAWVEGITILL